MTTKEEAELVITRLRSNGFSDEELVEAVMGLLKEMTKE